MNKKLTVFVVALVATMAIVAAALVPYLSNTVTADAEVQSPISLLLSKDGMSSWEEDVNLGSSHGGDSVVVHTKLENKANSPVTGSMLIFLKEKDDEELDWDCEMLTLYAILVDEDGNSLGYSTDLDCYVEEVEGVSGLKYRFPGNNVGTWGSHYTEYYEIQGQFHIRARPGDYLLKAQVIEAEYFGE